MIRLHKSLDPHKILESTFLSCSEDPTKTAKATDERTWGRSGLNLIILGKKRLKCQVLVKCRIEDSVIIISYIQVCSKRPWNKPGPRAYYCAHHVDKWHVGNDHICIWISLGQNEVFFALTTRLNILLSVEFENSGSPTTLISTVLIWAQLIFVIAHTILYLY